MGATSGKMTGSGSRPWVDGLLALGAGLAAFLVYFLTLAPSIVEGDSAEVVTAVYLAGVPHPTGYPLYALLGNGWLRLPWESPAYGLNLLSALFASLAVAGVFLLGRRLFRSRPAALAAALLFAFSRTFWSQALIAEVYALHLLFVAGVLGAVLTWDRFGERRWLLAAAGLYGLSFTHHLTSVLLAPALLYVGLTSPHRGQLFRSLPLCLPLFLAPLALYAYLPWAAGRNTAANWGDPSSLLNLIAHMTGRQYSGRMFHTGPDGILEQLTRYATAEGFLPSQFPLVLLPLALAGVVSLWRGQRRYAVLSLLIYGMGVFWAVNYSITDVEVYYLVPHLVMALWIGAGLRWVAGLARAAGRKQPQWKQVAAVTALAGLLLLPGSALGSNWQANDRHADWGTLTYARSALDVVKPDALVIGDGDSWWFPLQYARYVEGRRPDVVLASYYDLMLPERVRRSEPLARAGVRVTVPKDYPAPGGKPSPALVREVLAANVGQRPVYLLGEPVRLLSEEAWMQELMQPYHGRLSSNVPAYELSRTPLPVEADAAEGAVLAQFGRKSGSGVVPEVTLAGCRTEPVMRDGLPWLRVEYRWRLSDPALGKRLEVRAMFADADGNYGTLPDGSIDFNNFHSLGQGLPTRDAVLPAAFTERFNLYVPPVAWNRPVYLWLAVVRNGEFLPSVKGERYVRVGKLPEVAMDPRLLRAGVRTARN